MCSDYNRLEINGRRGSVELGFNLLEQDHVVGRGKKRMIVSGLREYDQADMDAAVIQYNKGKAAFAAQ